MISLPAFRISAAAAAVMLALPCRAQLDIRLTVDAESASRTLELVERSTGNPADIAALPGSRIALATGALITRRHLSEQDLTDALSGIRFGHGIADDPMGFRALQERREEVRELLDAVRHRAFSRRVAATVGQFFPEQSRIIAHVPVYIVVFGAPTVDAFVRRVIWREGSPFFVDEGFGEVTIVLNIAATVRYGRTTEERFIWTLSTVAHEVFHAAFGELKATLPEWRAFYSLPHSPAARLADLTQNEGVAHYMSFLQRTGGETPPDWGVRVRKAFTEFNERAEELLNPATTADRAQEILVQSNTAGYWDSYGAITGLFMAREIDLREGRSSLTASLLVPPDLFFRSYSALRLRDPSLPAISPAVLSAIGADQP